MKRKPIKDFRKILKGRIPKRKFQRVDLKELIKLERLRSFLIDLNGEVYSFFEEERKYLYNELRRLIESPYIVLEGDLFGFLKYFWEDESLWWSFLDNYKISTKWLSKNVNKSPLRDSFIAWTKRHKETDIEKIKKTLPKSRWAYKGIPMIDTRFYSIPSIWYKITSGIPMEILKNPLKFIKHPEKDISELALKILKEGTSIVETLDNTLEADEIL